MGVAEKKWGRALHVDSWKCFDYLQNSQTNWATDNHIASFIVSKGINKKHLQKLAVNFQYLFYYEIESNACWMARENNVTAEQFLKYIGASYWQVMDDFLSYLNNTQGQFTINRWASSENSKVL